MIPLYAVGVFTAFTLSQGGMVMRWLRLRERGLADRAGDQLCRARPRPGSVAVVVGFTNFTRGAWIVMLLIPLLILMFARHPPPLHRGRDRDGGADPAGSGRYRAHGDRADRRVNRVARQTLAYARSISPNVTAVHITDDEAEIEAMRAGLGQLLGTDIPLVIIESPYRSLVGPLLSYIDEIDQQRPDDTLTVVLPEFIARHWWEHLLHNQTALRIKAALLFRPGTVVTSVPYHLERSMNSDKTRSP